MDLFSLGLILVEIMDPAFRPVYADEEDARARLSGRAKPLLPESALTELRDSVRVPVSALLEESAAKRWSAAKVIKAPVFSIGMHTQLQDIKTGQAEVLEAIAEVRAYCCWDTTKCMSSLLFFPGLLVDPLPPAPAAAPQVKRLTLATQRIVVESGSTPVPRVAILVPADLSESASSLAESLARLNKRLGLENFFDLYLICEGCEFYPSVPCTKRHAKRISLPGKVLRDIAPVLKLGSMLYKVMRFEQFHLFLTLF